MELRVLGRVRVRGLMWLGVNVFILTSVNRDHLLEGEAVFYGNYYKCYILVMQM